MWDNFHEQIVDIRSTPTVFTYSFLGLFNALYQDTPSVTLASAEITSRTRNNKISNELFADLKIVCFILLILIVSASIFTNPSHRVDTCVLGFDLHIQLVTLITS